MKSTDGAIQRCFPFRNRVVNMKFKRMMILLGIFSCVICSSVTGCGGQDDKSNAKVIFTTGPGKNEIFRIGDMTCEKDELMVYLTNTQNQYEGVYSEKIWNTSLDGVTLEQNVKDTVLERLAQVKTMYLMAKDKGIELTKQEEEILEKAAKEYYKSLNETEINMMDVSEDTIYSIYEQYLMANKLYQSIIQDVNPEISDDEARIITVQHIFLRTYSKDADGNKVTLYGDKKIKLYDKACSIRQKAVEPEADFAELAAQYSDDKKLTYSFGRGEMDIAFENAAFKLDTNGISDVVESESGYHIIKCINTYDKDETEANKLVVREKRKNEAFGREYDAFVAANAKRLNDELWATIGLIHNAQVKTTSLFEVYDKYFQTNK